MGGRAIMIRDPDGQLIELTTFGFQDMRPPWPDENTPGQTGSGQAGTGIPSRSYMLPPMILRTSDSG